MSRRLETDEMTARYHQQEDYAKRFLARARRITDKDKPNKPITERERQDIRHLVGETLRAATEVRRLRRDIERYYPEADVGHDRAIDWVHDNLLVPGRALLDQFGLEEDPEWMEQVCRPHGVWHYHRMRRSADGLFDTNCEPARACMIDPGDAQQAYFFADVGMAIIDPRPGSTGDFIVQKPMLIVQRWSCLVAANIFTVDAVLSNRANKHEAYFFSGEFYALVNISEDRIVNGPKEIISEWPSLRAAGFKTIDAVLPHPYIPDQAYFFSDKMYALVYYNPGEIKDSIVIGPKVITNEWSSLREAGFHYIDSAMTNPDNPEEAYFFRGSDYVLVNICPGTTDDYIVNGPKLVHTEWPSLRAALFY
ncbi:transporter [Ganoderma sinense ZZ0214-1]|uniref:Transporter n=1 Tax=Ganoderma sinense ZZ0214-1 TaxID=1077348 RepID=A0A2G8RZX6_9APHY|nr:transporter [Ganoderma sinense ZZ0214-1]